MIYIHTCFEERVDTKTCLGYETMSIIEIASLIYTQPDFVLHQFYSLKILCIRRHTKTQSRKSYKRQSHIYFVYITIL